MLFVKVMSVTENRLSLKLYVTMDVRLELTRLIVLLTTTNFVIRLKTNTSICFISYCFRAAAKIWPQRLKS